jgi:hypothetical protein
MAPIDTFIRPPSPSAISGQSFQKSIADLGGGTRTAVLTYALLLFVVLIAFVGYGELQRVLGKGKLEQIFFRPRPPLPN